ncbi:MAG: ABC transporter ATP-binding protein [Planctomycetaceae bacterium]|nr:ABC transporter ATP-binding protein [Planctomycetaceae bacterium]
MLEVTDLAYSYGARNAVQQANFTIHKGECLGLLGPNGAGKTTTISCIVGLLGEWNGTMTMNGADFCPTKRQTDRGRLGFVPQELAVYQNLTAEENLHLFAKLHGLRRQQRQQAVYEKLELAGLSDRRRDLVGTFSGGMKRRLNLVAGLMHSPSLVLLDEPTVGVDPQSRNHLFEMLVRLKSEGVALLYTTHYMEEAQRLCDRLAIMNEGAIVATGTPNELAEQIGEPEADLEQVFLQLTGRSLKDL